MAGEIEKIRTVLSVADFGGFARAGRHLGLSATIVTRHVAELEADLGVQLFTRTTRKVALTDAGQVYVDKTRSIMEDLSEARATVQARQSGLQGPLKISVPLSFGQRFLPSIITRFRGLHPGVDLNLQLTDNMVDLASGAYDMALRISEMPTDQSTIWRRICLIPRLLLASPEYLAEAGVPSKPADLAQLLCLHYGDSAQSPVWRLSDGVETVQIRLNSCVTCNNGDLLGALAEQGQGIAVLPQFIVQPALDSGRLVTVLDGWYPPQIWLAAAFPPYDRLPARVAAFTEFIETEMTGP
ncbi:MAG: LysR substrate-binding domain-containing protein [Pseudomonadota bacterium]